jgi:hypothetical protein
VSVVVVVVVVVVAPVWGVCARRTATPLNVMAARRPRYLSFVSVFMFVWF